MNKSIIFSVGISLIIIGGALWLGSQSLGGAPGVATVVDGTQFIDVTAKGAYSPHIITATAGMPTILRVKTSGTFDCSSGLVIPKLSYQKFLQPSGTEEVVISPDEAQGTMQGLCSMGMYNFQIRFE